MRLIDADELIKNRVSNDPVVIAAKCAPAVYDINGILEYLKSEAARWEESGKEYKDKRELGVAEGYRRAAKDVESGRTE